MLKIKTKVEDFFDEETNQFIKSKSKIITLEHSLLSISKWESIFKKSFFSNISKITEKEFITYIECMIINDEYTEEDLYSLVQNNISDIQEYMADSNTATTFHNFSNNENLPTKQEKITSEKIYFWLVFFQIPFSTESWNINRLLALIGYCNSKQQKNKKLTKAEEKSMLLEMDRINEKRKAELKSTG